MGSHVVSRSSLGNRGVNVLSANNTKDDKAAYVFLLNVLFVKSWCELIYFIR